MEDGTRSESERVFVKAYDFASSCDLRAARQTLEAGMGGRVLESDPLLVQFDNRRMVAVFDYGAAAFFNYPGPEGRQLLERLRASAVRVNRVMAEDDFTLHLAPRMRRPEGTEAMTIREFNRDIAMVVGIVLSRSVSLEYYENQVDNVLSRIESTVGQLAATGWMPRRLREPTRQVGFALSVELDLAYSVAVLEDPDVVWDGGARVAELYTALKREFDLEDRIRGVREKISIISRSSTFILSRLEAQRASTLEWIIILLILSEIVLALAGKL